MLHTADHDSWLHADRFSKCGHLRFAYPSSEEMAVLIMMLMIVVVLVVVIVMMVAAGRSWRSRSPLSRSLSSLRCRSRPACSGLVG